MVSKINILRANIQLFLCLFLKVLRAAVTECGALLSASVHPQSIRLYNIRMSETEAEVHNRIHLRVECRHSNIAINSEAISNSSKLVTLIQIGVVLALPLALALAPL